MTPFPFDEFVEIDGHFLNASEVVQALESLVQPRRKARIEKVIESRCFGIQPILESLADRGNMSAVLRTIEGLGMGAVHVVEARRKKLRMANRVSQGAEKWLEIQRWHTTEECVAAVKREGLQLVVTDLNASASIDDLDLSKPTALVFGNEKFGASELMREHADHTVILPMAGFSQSFNISVAAAISLHHLRLKRFGQTAGPGDLDESQKVRLRAEYFRKSVGESDRILQELASRLAK